MKTRGAVLITMLCLLGLLGLTPSAFAGGSGTSFGFYDNHDPNQTTNTSGERCDAGAVDVPETVRPIYIDNALYGEFVVRASITCVPARWAEVRFTSPMGYKITVESLRLKTDAVVGGHSDYSVNTALENTQSPVFDDMLDPSDTCTVYSGVVINPIDETRDSISEELCLISPPPIMGPPPIVLSPVSNPEPHPSESSTVGPTQSPSPTITQQPKTVTTTKKKVKKPAKKCKKTKKVKKCKPAKKVSKKTKSSRKKPEHTTVESGGGA